MPLPAAALIGGGIAAGGIAGSIFGRKKIPKYDISGIQNLVQQGGEEQRAQIARIRPETQKLTDQFRMDTAGAQDKAKAAREAERTRYLSELDPVTSRLLQNQSDQLKQGIFGAIPEAQRSAREALAASGGLDRGIAAEELARIPVNAAQEYSRGVAGLQAQSLGTMQQALSNLQSQESQAIATNLGIDQDTYQTILNTGNEALINELNGLIEESRRRSESLQNAEMFRQTGNVAAASADEANRQATWQAITGLGGTIAGMGSGGGAGAVAVPAAQRRRAIAPRYRDTAGVQTA